MSTSWELCKKLHDQGKARKLNLKLNAEVWLVDPRTGDQIEIAWLPLSGCYDLAVVPNDGKNKKQNRTWKVFKDSTEALNTESQERQEEELPESLASRLGSFGYLPRAYSLYGYREKGRTVALIDVWVMDSLEDEWGVRMTPYILPGQQAPRLYRVWRGHDFLDAPKWWAAMASGTLYRANDNIARSHQPVRWKHEPSRSGSPYILVEDESWTGLGSPGVYVSSFATGSITLDEALAAGGMDVRASYRR